MTLSPSTFPDTKSDHPMQPSPALIVNAVETALAAHPDVLQAGRLGMVAGHVGRALYAAGADAELEACVKWLQSKVSDDCFPGDLRAARRPKPPTKKELALEAIQRIDENAVFNMKSYEIYDELKRDIHFLCSVVNSIQDDEKSND